MAEAIPLPPNHDSLRDTALGVAWGFFAAATLFIVARLYVRLWMRKNAGWDDFWIVVAWLFSAYTCVCTQLAGNNGAGQHLAFVLGSLKNLLFYVLLIEVGLSWGISLVKISVIAFVLRLINKNPGLRHIRWLCYLDLALFLPITVAMFLVFTLQCIPLSSFWNEIMPPSKCMGHKVLGDVVTVYAAASAVSDLLTGILPIFIISRVQMDRPQKISIIFLTGVVCCISATAIYKAVVAPTVFNSADPSYQLAKLSISCSIELNLGMIAATLPTLPPLFEAMGLMKDGAFRPLRSRHSGSGYSGFGQFGSFGSTAGSTTDEHQQEKPSSQPPSSSALTVPAPVATNPSTSTTHESGVGFTRMLAAYNPRLPSRKISEATLIEEEGRGGGDLDDFLSKHLDQNSLITRTIDVEVSAEQDSDRGSVREGEEKEKEAMFPWVHVGRRYTTTTITTANNSENTKNRKASR